MTHYKRAKRVTFSVKNYKHQAVEVHTKRGKNLKREGFQLTKGYINKEWRKSKEKEKGKIRKIDRVCKGKKFQKKVKNYMQKNLLKNTKRLLMS